MGIVMRFPNGKAKVFTMSYDDGRIQDVRLISIMNQYGLKGTFNLNSGMLSSFDTQKTNERMSEKQIKELYLPSGHEVALHTHSHPFLTGIPVEHVTYEYMKDRECLEDIFGAIIRGSAYPHSKYDETVLNCLRACGVVYARNGSQTHKFDLPVDWLQWAPTVRHIEPELFPLLDKFIEMSPRNYQPCAMFYLMGHSFEFDRDDNWDVIYTLAEKVANRQDIWYATNIEIYDYVEAFRSVRFNVTGTLAYNPTITDVWIVKNGKTYRIEAGKTTKLAD
jgi:hypothetical protein